jgi:hypothetical protein
VPVPLQKPAGVSVEPEQLTDPQGVAVEACSQVPPAAHLPSLPHGMFTVHCPLGAGVPPM